MWIENALGPRPEKWTADHYKGKENQKSLPVILQKHYLDQEEWGMIIDDLVVKYPYKPGA